MTAWEWAGTIALVLLFGPSILYVALGLWISMYLLIRELWESRGE
jgi:hypothetical protein